MITITTNARALAADISTVPAKLRAGIKPLLERVASRLQRTLSNDKITAGGILEPRTGNLRRSIFTRVEADNPDDASAAVGFDLAVAPYGRVQELGGTILPKRGQYLTIPIGQALTEKGVSRFTARDLFASPGSLGYTGAFVAKGVIFGRLMDDVVPLFVLKRSVTLPARRPLASTLDRETPWIIEQFEQLSQQATEPPPSGGTT